MHFEGSHTFSAKQDKLWKLLNDPDVLARITPALQELHPIADDKFNATFGVKVGPIKGTFKGNLDIVNKVEPDGYTLLVQMKSKLGSVAAEGKLKLNEENDSTALNFAGDLKLSRLLARAGEKVMSSAANMFTEKFFNGLEKEVRK